FTSLPAGTWNYTLVIQDLTGNINSSSVIVTVTLGAEPEEIAPQISHPQNKTLFFGETGQYVDFYLFDENPSTIKAVLDGEAIFNTPWTVPNQKIRVYLEDLQVGTHVLTVTAIDAFNNTASRTITVTVEGDENPPEVGQPEFDKVNMVITWSVTEENPAYFTVVLLNNGTVLANSTYSSGSITFKIENIPPGEYNIRLTVYDGFGHKTVVETIFTVPTSASPGFGAISVLFLLFLVPLIRVNDRITRRKKE
ncbi:MAG: hypothetical protein ACTSP4_13670, partial [Candidatus Hodarchaeales archaeon]